MHTRRAICLALLATAAATACSDSKPAMHHYNSAQKIADTLASHHLTVSRLRKSTEDTYISEVGGTAYDFTVTDKADQPTVGDSGINMFPNHKALTTWTGVSQSLGGVAVTGDTWAVSLPTGSKAAREDSKRLAPVVAKALGGTVEQ